jgi:PAS domain S-box-containing protein
MQKEESDEYHLLEEYKKAVDECSIFSRTDLKGIITYANDKFCEISGYSRNELVGHNHNIIRDPYAPKELYKELWQTIQSKKIWKGKITNRKKCGESYIVEATIVPILDKDGNIEEYISLRHDITELEHLKKEEIRHIKTDSVCKLAGGVAHEINTPMTYIKGNIEFIEMYLEDIDNTDAKKSIEESISTIKDGINRITNIVSAVREISDTTNLTYEKANLSEIVLNVCRLIFNRSKHISPIYINDKIFDLGLDQYEFEHIDISINKHKIKQVFIALVNNALDEFVRKESNPNKNRIDIDYKSLDNSIIITISDNGGGIPDSILDKIFEPFCTNKDYAGLGIGLNLVKNIIDEHNGEIKAYNRDQGAIFEIHLPINIKR